MRAAIPLGCCVVGVAESWELSWFFFLISLIRTVGAYGEWSAEVDTLIGQVAEIASACPEGWAVATGRRRRAAGTRTGRGRTFIARCSGRSRGAGTRRWTACSTARRRRMRVTRSTAASWMTLPTNPALPTLGTPPASEERSGAHPAAAPKLSLYIWPCIRLRSAPCLRTLPGARDAWRVCGLFR